MDMPGLDDQEEHTNNGSVWTQDVNKKTSRERWMIESQVESPKVNIIARLENKLAYLEASLQHVNHYTSQKLKRIINNKLLQISLMRIRMD